MEFRNEIELNVFINPKLGEFVQLEQKNVVQNKRKIQIIKKGKYMDYREKNWYLMLWTWGH